MNIKCQKVEPDKIKHPPIYSVVALLVELSLLSEGEEGSELSVSREHSISDRALSSLVELLLVHRYEKDQLLECSDSSIASRDTVTPQYEFHHSAIVDLVLDRRCG